MTSILDRVRPKQWHKYLLVVMTVAVLGFSTGCMTKNPATGRTNLDMFTDEQEMQMGKEATPELLASYGGPIRDQQVQAYVYEVGMQLVAVCERPELEWEFYAVDSAVINAFALPGGKIFITRGLLEKFNTRAQLAGVLGHEVAHVTAQHARQAITQAILIQTAVAIAAASLSEDEEVAMGVALLGGAGGQLYGLKFSRDNEYEADRLGLRYMVKAGYNPKGLVEVMEVLLAAGGGGGVEFLSTHPLTDKRIDALRDQIDQDYSYALSSDYISDQASYRKYILDRLKRLPPPRHTGK